MNEYIFYTPEGFTQGPDGNDVENCQLVGSTFGEDADDALHHLLSDNPWIEEHHFDPCKFICRQLA